MIFLDDVGGFVLLSLISIPEPLSNERAATGPAVNSWFVRTLLIEGAGTLSERLLEKHRTWRNAKNPVLKFTLYLHLRLDGGKRQLCVCVCVCVWSDVLCCMMTDAWITWYLAVLRSLPLACNRAVRFGAKNVYWFYLFIYLFAGLLGFFWLFQLFG